MPRKQLKTALQFDFEALQTIGHYHNCSIDKARLFAVDVINVCRGKYRLTPSYWEVAEAVKRAGRASWDRGVVAKLAEKVRRTVTHPKVNVEVAPPPSRTPRPKEGFGVTKPNPEMEAEKMRNGDWETD